MTCKLCTAKKKARNLCGKHYQRWLRHGSAEITKRAPAGSGTVDHRGYRWITVNGTPVLEHRHIMHLYLRRTLASTELVHHIDGNKLNNAIKNLELKTAKVHMHDHMKYACNTDSEHYCPYCMRLLQITAFVKSKNGRIASYCKSCMNIYQSKSNNHRAFTKSRRQRVVYSQLNQKNLKPIEP